MFKALFKIIFLALVIFACMVGYDSYMGEKSVLQKNTSSTVVVDKSQTAKGNNSQNIKGNQKVTDGPSLEERKLTKHEKSAIKSIFLAIMPEKNTWPEPIQKTYRAFNMDEIIDPLREKPDWVRLSNMSRDIPQALIAIEDHDFYNHGAIAMDGIIRAVLINISAGEVVQGGSTLTQQLVKNLFLSQERTMGRKVEEVILSLILEQQYTKDEILEMYLNTTYLGANTNGIKQAARKYFDKAPSNVTLAEAAVLASLPYAPSALNPLENPQGCKKRQLLVLESMQKYGFISQTQYKEAIAEKIRLTNGKRM